jgi:hypothetical protein
MHDERVGKGAVAHLFRLPLAQERELAELLRNVVPGSLLQDIEDTDSALDALKTMRRAVSPATAAVRVGPLQDVMTPDGIGQMAGYYHEAFTSGHDVFPYFTDS